MQAFTHVFPPARRMVYLLVKIKCELENLTNLAPGEDFTYHFKLVCANCGEVSKRESTLNAEESFSTQPRGQKSGHGNSQKDKAVANLIQKCDLCERTGTLAVVEGHGKPYTAEDSEKGAFVPIICLDCRGMQPAEFFPGPGWTAEGAESGTKFLDIDLSEGEFSEYDEKVAASVGILGFESEIVKTKL